MEGADCVRTLMGLWHFPARTSGSIPYIISCISLHRGFYETALFGEGPFDVQLRSGAQALRRHPQREGCGEVKDLISLLQAVIKEDQEEIRIRMAFLAEKYANALSDSEGC
jgi:hypothetical protein